MFCLPQRATATSSSASLLAELRINNFAQSVMHALKSTSVQRTPQHDKHNTEVSHRQPQWRRGY